MTIGAFSSSDPPLNSIGVAATESRCRRRIEVAGATLFDVERGSEWSSSRFELKLSQNRQSRRHAKHDPIVLAHLFVSYLAALWGEPDVLWLP